MKTLVVGTGVIGTIYGWAMAEAGADVTHLVRAGHAIGEETVRLDVLDERKGHRQDNVTTFQRRLVESIDPGDRYELMVVPVNTFQVEEVLRDLVDRSGDALVLLMSANWDGPAAIDAVLPRKRYLLAYPDGGGTIRDGLYWTNLGAELHIGLIDGQPPENLEKVRHLFARADITLDVPADILHWLWVHNASAVAIAAGYAKYGSVKPFLRDRALLTTCFKATRELLALCEARGVAVKDYGDVAMLAWPTWLTIPLMRWMWTHNKSMQRYTAHASSPGAMREIAESYRAMLATADELSVAVPNLRSVGAYLDRSAGQVGFLPGHTTAG